MQQKNEAKLAVVADRIFCLSVHPSYVETSCFGMDANISWYFRGISVNKYAYEKNASIHLCPTEKKTPTTKKNQVMDDLIFYPEKNKLLSLSRIV